MPIHPISFLQAHINTSAPFAVIALPVNRDGQRKFHHFSKVPSGFIDPAGTTLALQSFPDGESERPLLDSSVKEQYVSMVEKAIEQMKGGVFEKVVLARTKVVRYVQPSSLVRWYERLLEAYPTALVFALSIDGEEIWLGATPELLINKTDSVYQTLALAGTHTTPGTPWTPKEYDEHGHVATYLLRELEKLGVQQVGKEGPYETQYGRLAHLRTDMSFRSDLTLQELVATLHPTPALCGLPQQNTLEFIGRHEPTPRRFYTGSMVLEHANGDGTAYAFLRCGVLSKEQVLTMYAGCGIVAASDPEQEWLESEAKINSVLALL